MTTAADMAARETIDIIASDGPAFVAPKLPEQLRRLRAVLDDLEAGRPVAFAMAYVREDRPGMWSMDVRAVGISEHAVMAAQLQAVTEELAGKVAEVTANSRRAWRAAETDAGLDAP